MKDLVDRNKAMTDIQFAAKRLTLAYEAHGEGHVVYSDLVIPVAEVLGILRNLPSEADSCPISFNEEV